MIVTYNKRENRYELKDCKTLLAVYYVDTETFEWFDEEAEIDDRVVEFFESELQYALAEEQSYLEYLDEEDNGVWMDDWSFCDDAYIEDTVIKAYKVNEDEEQFC